MTDKQKLTEGLKRRASQFRSLAGDELKFSRERQFAAQIIGQSKDLRTADTDSLCMAVLQAAGMGLTLSPTAGLCYLIPRRARKKRDGESWDQYKKNVSVLAYASPSYKGLVYLAIKSGAVTWVASEVVFAADKYEDLGPFHAPVHMRTTVQGERREGKAIGVYCVAKLPDHSVLCEYMDRDTVQRIRRMSDVPDGLMWHPDKLWTQGWRKAVIRRAFNSWPRVATDNRLDYAQGVMDLNEGITLDAEAVETPEVALIGEEQLTQFSALLLEHDRPDPDKDLNRLARRFGKDRIEDLELSSYASALEMLRQGIARIGT